MKHCQPRIIEDTDFFSLCSLYSSGGEKDLFTVSNSSTLLNDWSCGSEADSKQGNGGLGEEHGGELDDTRATGLGIDRGVDGCGRRRKKPAGKREVFENQKRKVYVKQYCLLNMTLGFTGVPNTVASVLLRGDDAREIV